jgi:hypothetical protein
MAFFSITSDNKAVAALLTSSPVFTSVIKVQAFQRLNIGIIIGSKVSDILSARAFSAAISAVVGTLSASITLQRRMREDMGQASTLTGADWTWRDVDDWSVLAATGENASEENITTTQEPETCEYRIGCKSGEYQTGEALLRLGTSGS